MSNGKADKSDTDRPGKTSKPTMGEDFESTFIVEDDEPVNFKQLLGEFADKGMTGDKYIIDGKIAQGGMGAIYKVRDHGLQRTTVLKVILPEVLSNSELFTRFIEEARITGQLEHPNIIPVHDIGVLDGERLYFSMKYIEGEELRAVIRKLREDDKEYATKYKLFTLLTMFRKICDATAFAHSRGFIHRDIKPDNIMVGEYGEVLLVDWGLARPEDKPDKPVSGARSRDTLLDMDLSASLTKTRDGIIKGTPAYMSPEQAKGEVDKVDRRTDIFLLGATLYALATLRTPYSGDDIYEILTNAENANFPHPQQVAPHRHIPDALCDIIIKAMSYHPDDRYQHVDELSEDIDALLEGRAVSVEKSFAAGEALMTEGETGDEAYVIVEGEVEVTKTIGKQQITLVRLGEGAILGEMALISKAPRSATVTALSATKVVVITEELMKTALEKLPPWMGKAIEAMVGRLREANAIVHPLARGDCSYHVLNQLRYLYPYAGEQMRLSGTEHMVITLGFDTAVQEIAFNLSIGPDRVAAVFASLVQAGLLQALDDDRFYVPNYNLLADFTDYVRELSDAKAPVDHDRSVEFFASPTELVCSLTNPDHEPEEAQIEPIHNEAAEKVMGLESFEQIPERFDQIVAMMRKNLGLAP